MLRGWPFNWPDFAPSSEPRALRAFEHMPKVEVKENGKAYSVTVELPDLEEKDGHCHGDRSVSGPSGRNGCHRDEQDQRRKRAALKLMRKLLKKYGFQTY